MTELNNQTVDKPLLPVKILQFGEGNFLRAFVDWMVHKANTAGVMNHGIVAVQPIAQGLAGMLKEQDSMYHVYLEGIKDRQPVKEITLVKSLVDTLNPYEEYASYEKIFLSETLEMIISNTTEAGIRYEEGDNLTARPPKSYPAKITALLHQRFKKFNGDPAKGLLIICCELIENNGSTLREYVVRHATANNLGDDFIAWTNTACRFYDTLVDRIVPGFPRETIDEIKAEIGFNDHLVLKGEYFHVWAIGGDPIIKEKLPLDKAGLNVLFMDDIKPFRAKKVRILNGSHTAMVPVALQMGCTTVMDAFRTPLIENYINRMVNEETLPMIREDAETLKAFSEKILERFYNPYIKHYLKDISLNSLSKWEARNFPTVYDNSRHGKSAKLTIFSFAALIVLYSGRSEVPFAPNDTPEFVAFIRESFDAADPEKWVRGIVCNKEIWTEDLDAVPGFTDAVVEDVKLIIDKGMRGALEIISA
jgi:tagaturonate reductase